MQAMEDKERTAEQESYDRRQKAVGVFKRGRQISEFVLTNCDIFF